MLRLLNMIFLLLLVFHVLGLFIYYAASFNRLWVPPSDGVYGTKIWDEGNYLLKYATCFVYSIRMYTVHDIAAVKLIERIYIGYAALLSAIINANIFGQISVLISDMNKKKISF